MSKLSAVLILLIVIPPVLAFFFPALPYSENVLNFITQGGEARMIIILAVICVIAILPQIIQGTTRGIREVAYQVKSLTEDGTEGWGKVKKIYRSGKRLGGNTLYFLDLEIEDESGCNYSITAIHPVPRKQLGFFIPGSVVPVKSAKRDRTMIVFPQLDYSKMRGFLFLNQHSDIWKQAELTKEEISLKTIEGGK